MRLLALRVLPALVLMTVAVAFEVTPSPARAAQAAEPCWQRVIADWADNGSVDNAYTPACYRAAMANAPTDLRIYSTLEGDLQRALLIRTARRISVDASQRPVVHGAVLSGSLSTSSVVIALGAGLGLIAAAVSTALLLARTRRR